MNVRQSKPTEKARRTERSRGQALVETALMLPVILILLLGAIDFGRLFLSWVTLHQAARIAANEASIHPDTTSADVPALIQTETDVMNCAAGTPTLLYTEPDGTATAAAQVGDFAHVTLACDFSLLTPLAGIFFGDPIHMTAVSTFPVRTGALGIGGGSGPPPPPPPEQCRLVPDFEGMSIGGAREAWASAGFTGSFVTPADDHETVDTSTIAIAPQDESCGDGLEIFNATITVQALTAEGSPPGPPDCAVLPNLIGMTVADARAAWDDSDFTGDFEPPPPDADPDAVVTGQEASQDGSPLTAEPGVSCLEVATDIEVTLGDAWPAPPNAPCQVPHLIDKTRPVGESEWYGSGFVSGTFSPINGNWKIQSQSLQGLSWAQCDAQITVSQQP